MTNHCKPYKEQLVEHQKRLEEIRRNNELIRSFLTKEETEELAFIEGWLNKRVERMKKQFWSEAQAAYFSE